MCGPCLVAGPLPAADAADAGQGQEGNGDEGDAGADQLRGEMRHVGSWEERG